MRLKVKVKAKAKHDCVERSGDGSYKVWVKAAPENGKANRAVIGVLSEYLNISRSKISILTGQTSGDKVIDISV